MVSINRLGGTLEQQSPPVTLPRYILPEIDIEREAQEAAARIAERKVIRAGVDAWQAIGKAESFENWKAVGNALAIGKAHALRVTGANAPWGRNYSRVFCDWMCEYRFDRMPKSVRSVAIELHENIDAITTWRATLSERDRRRLVHPLSNVRRWRAAMVHGEAKCPTDLKRDARVAWRKFVSCVEALPADQASPLWQLAHDQASARLAAGSCHSGGQSM